MSSPQPARRYVLVTALLVALGSAVWLVLAQLPAATPGEAPQPTPSTTHDPQAPRPEDPGGSSANVDESAIANAADRREAISPQPAEPHVGTPSLTVRTITSEGEDLVGCRLSLRSARAFRGERRYEQALHETSEARHVATTIPKGDYDIVSSTPNLRQPVARLTWNGTESQSLTVNIASRLDLIGGSVRYPAGRPAPGALVLDAGESTQAFFCVADAAGRFMFCRRKGRPTTKPVRCRCRSAKMAVSKSHFPAVTIVCAFR